MQEEENNFASFADESDSARGQFRGESGPLVMPDMVEGLDSSPNVRDMAFEGPPLSPAEKRRNKLGYHRTAVACGHCRRRKIRCLPAFDDPVGRCQNCIRLKKECQFFPVDQQNPGPGRRVRSATKSTEGGPNEAELSAASSSPSGILRSASFDRFEQMDGRLDTPPVSRNSPGYSGFHPGSRSMSGTGFDYTNPYNYRQQARPHQNQSQQFYQPYGNSSQAGYPAGFISGSVPANMTMLPRDSAYDYQISSPNGEYSWGQPSARSVSMGERGDSTHGLRAAYRTQTYPSIERRVTGDMHHLSSTSPGFMPVSVERQPGTNPNFPEPMSYQPIPVEMPQEWSGQQQRAQLSGSSGAQTPVWYPQQIGLIDVRDDEHRPHILPSNHLNPR